MRTYTCALLAERNIAGLYCQHACEVELNPNSSPNPEQQLLLNLPLRGLLRIKYVPISNTFAQIPWLIL